MHRLSLALLAAFSGGMTATDSLAQSDGRDRVKEIRAVYIWQRNVLSEAQLRQTLTQMRSSDPATARAAVETVALAKPIPSAAETVLKALNDVVSRTQDQTTRLIATEACRDWGEAKQAWDLIQEARRRGGFRALEQLLTQDRAPRQDDALIAIAYSDNGQAPTLLAEHWRISLLKGPRALEIIGPPAAPFLAEQLAPNDLGLCLQVAPLMGKIGTEAQIPALEQLAATGLRLHRLKAEEAIASIRSRATPSE